MTSRGCSVRLAGFVFVLVTSFCDVVVSVPANHRYSSIVADDLHIEYHPSSSLIGQGASAGGSSEYGTYHEGTYISDWSRDWSIPSGTVGGRLNVAKCVDIPSNMSLCRNIGYEQMRLPNLLDHDTLAETTHQASSWVPLLNLHCHQDTKMFLCSLFAPVCLDRPIYPCQTLCQAVKSGCEARMLKYGFPWPEMLNCDKFPLDDDLCIGIQNEQQAQTDDAVCSACSQPDTFENIMDNFCQSEFVMRIRLAPSASSATIEGNDIRLTANKRKQLKKTERFKLKGQLQFYIENGAYCQCNGIALASSTQTPRRNSVGQATGSGSATPTSNTGGYLVMGSRRSDRLIVSFIQPLDKHSASQTRALNAMKQENICKSVVAGSPTRNSGSRGAVGGARKSSETSPGGRGSKHKSRQQAAVSSVSTTTPVSAAIKTTTTTTRARPSTTTMVATSTTTEPISFTTLGNKRKYGGARNGGLRQNTLSGKQEASSTVVSESSTAAEISGGGRRTGADNRKRPDAGQQRVGSRTKGNAATSG